MGYTPLFFPNSNHGRAWLTSLDQDLWPCDPCGGSLEDLDIPNRIGGEYLLEKNNLIGSRLPQKDQVRSRALS